MIMNVKQKKIKIESRIKLNYNIYKLQKRVQMKNDPCNAMIIFHFISFPQFKYTICSQSSLVFLYGVFELTIVRYQHMRPW